VRPGLRVDIAAREDLLERSSLRAPSIQFLAKSPAALGELSRQPPALGGVRLHRLLGGLVARHRAFEDDVQQERPIAVADRFAQRLRQLVRALDAAGRHAHGFGEAVEA
jgi:hypothetical protein